MERIGATKSRLAIRTPASAKIAVKMRAKVGSLFQGETFLNIRRNDMRSSLAIACNSRGALREKEGLTMETYSHYLPCECLQACSNS